MKPVMLTFGAGAWAYARGAARATRAKAIIRTARLVLFIETLLNQVDDDAFLQRVLASPPAIRATTVHLERRVFSLVTSPGEQNRKRLDLFTAKPLFGSRKNQTRRSENKSN
jgi:hypothetical protein